MSPKLQKELKQLQTDSRDTQEEVVTQTGRPRRTVPRKSYEEDTLIDKEGRVIGVNESSEEALDVSETSSEDTERTTSPHTTKVGSSAFQDDTGRRVVSETRVPETSVGKWAFVLSKSNYRLLMCTSSGKDDSPSPLRSARRSNEYTRNVMHAFSQQFSIMTRDAHNSYRRYSSWDSVDLELKRRQRRIEELETEVADLQRRLNLEETRVPTAMELVDAWKDNFFMTKRDAGRLAEITRDIALERDPRYAGKFKSA